MSLITLGFILISGCIFIAHRESRPDYAVPENKKMIVAFAFILGALFIFIGIVSVLL